MKERVNHDGGTRDRVKEGFGSPAREAGEAECVFFFLLSAMKQTWSKPWSAGQNWWT